MDCRIGFCPRFGEFVKILTIKKRLKVKRMLTIKSQLVWSRSVKVQNKMVITFSFLIRNCFNELSPNMFLFNVQSPESIRSYEEKFAFLLW